MFYIVIGDSYSCLCKLPAASSAMFQLPCTVCHVCLYDISTLERLGLCQSSTLATFFIPFSFQFFKRFVSSNVPLFPFMAS